MQRKAGASRPALWLVIDEEPAAGRLIRNAAGRRGVEVECGDLDRLAVALRSRTPDVVFLDVPLGAADAIEAIRMMEGAGFVGAVQVMAGHDAALADFVHLIGERHGLRMLPPVMKPPAPEFLAGLPGPADPVPPGGKESAEAVQAPA